MQRIFLPIALIVMVLVGTWLIWPQPEPRTPLGTLPTASEPAPPPAPAVVAPDESAMPAAGRTEAGSTSPAAPQVTQLVVHCVDRSGQRPLAGVEVRATGYAQLVTDSDGRAAFDVQPGVAFAVSADDLAHRISFESAEVAALAPGETRELKFQHEVGEHAHFCGLVVAREGGAPVAGAEVRVGGELRTRSDSAGRFEFDYAGFQPPPIRIDAQGFGPAVVGAGPGHESAEDARRIELDRAAALRIALQVPEGQLAARLELHAEGYQLSRDEAFTTDLNFSTARLKWEANADAQWICSLGELPPGVSLVAEVIGTTGVLFHAAEPIVLKPGEERRLEWDLRGCELVGHVYEADGKPAADITLWLLRGQSGFRPYVASYQTEDLVGRATSAADGSYRFSSVSPGTWLLAPRPVDLKLGTTPEDAIASVPLEVTIRAGESRSVLDVHIARGLYIRGTLVAPDGSTGVTGYVYARGPGGESLHVNTDPKGVFALGPLGGGTFSLEGSASNTYLSSVAIAVDAGARDVVLRSRPGAEVAGQVVDGESGAGVLAAITVGGEDGSMTMTRTQPDGNFRFDGLAAGRYTLFASTSAGQAGELAGVVLDPGAPLSGLAVALKPGAKVRIRYEGSGIGQANVRRNGASIGGDGVEGGRSLTQIVTPGRVAVAFRFPGVEKPEVQEIELAPGEERELVFKAPPAR